MRLSVKEEMHGRYAMSRIRNTVRNAVHIILQNEGQRKKSALTGVNGEGVI